MEIMFYNRISLCMYVCLNHKSAGLVLFLNGTKFIDQRSCEIMIMILGIL